LLVLVSNSYRKSLSGEDAQALLQNIISWLIRCVEGAEGPLVVRKLCSTLVAYFLQFSATWTHCVAHLIYCLCIGQPTPYDALSEAPSSAILTQNISKEKAVVILWFATTLVEDVGKTDSNSMKMYVYSFDHITLNKLTTKQASLPPSDGPEC
jgi:hypothetical protein